MADSFDSDGETETLSARYMDQCAWSSGNEVFFQVQQWLLARHSEVGRGGLGKIQPHGLTDGATCPATGSSPASSSRLRIGNAIPIAPGEMFGGADAAAEVDYHSCLVQSNWTYRPIRFLEQARTPFRKLPRQPGS